MPDKTITKLPKKYCLAFMPDKDMTAIFLLQKKPSIIQVIDS